MPGNPQALSSRLRRAAPLLRNEGIDVLGLSSRRGLQRRADDSAGWYGRPYKRIGKRETRLG